VPKLLCVLAEILVLPVGGVDFSLQKVTSINSGLLLSGLGIVD